MGDAGDASRVVYAARGLRLYYARGAFDQRFLPQMRGEAVAVFEYDFSSDGTGRTLVASRATGYLQVDNAFLRALGKVAAPFVQAKADKEAGQLLRVFARASRAIEENPREVIQKVSAASGRPATGARALSGAPPRPVTPSPTNRLTRSLPASSLASPTRRRER